MIIKNLTDKNIMKRIIFCGFIFFCLTCFSSCFFYRDLKNKTKVQDIYMVYKDDKGFPLFSANIYCYNTNLRTHKEKDTSSIKLSYLFNAHNIRNFDNPIIELHSFSFTQKNGDTIPCALYYNSNQYITRDRMNNNTNIKIDTLPFNFDINKHQTGVFNILVEADQLYHKTKIVYVSYDITVNNQRITKYKIKYKRKLCVGWLG